MDDMLEKPSKVEEKQNGHWKCAANGWFSTFYAVDEIIITLIVHLSGLKHSISFPSILLLSLGQFREKCI